MQINNLSGVAQNGNKTTPNLVREDTKDQNGNCTYIYIATRGHAKQMRRKTQIMKLELKSRISKFRKSLGNTLKNYILISC